MEGFIWDINSFDQCGVELGKALAKNVRGALQKNISGKTTDAFEGYGFNGSTSAQLEFYLKNRNVG